MGKGRLGPHPLSVDPSLLTPVLSLDRSAGRQVAPVEFGALGLFGNEL